MSFTASLRISELHRRITAIHNRMVSNGLEPDAAVDECVELLLEYINHRTIREMVEACQIEAQDFRKRYRSRKQRIINSGERVEKS